jgi:hypothetical protein
MGDVISFTKTYAITSTANACPSTLKFLPNTKMPKTPGRRESAAPNMLLEKVLGHHLMGLEEYEERVLEFAYSGESVLVQASYLAANTIVNCHIESLWQPISQQFQKHPGDYMKLCARKNNAIFSGKECLG